MKFTADPEKTQFDTYFAEDIVDTLTTVAQTAARLGLDAATVDNLLTLVAEKFHLTVTPS